MQTRPGPNQANPTLYYIRPRKIDLPIGTLNNLSYPHNQHLITNTAQAKPNKQNPVLNQ